MRATREECEYSLPHPAHHWWVDGTTNPVSNYRSCQGSGTADEKYDKHYIGMFEASELGTPTGDKHLHYLNVKGRWEWIVRWGRSKCCGTSRCRPVKIAEIPQNHDVHAEAIYRAFQDSS